MAIQSYVDIQKDGASAFAAGGGATRGTTVLDFGSFPGSSDASVAVVQAPVLNTTVVKAWLYPLATTDHSADEHMVETLKVFAGKVVAGIGFTIYGFNTDQIVDPKGNGTRLYGKWTVAWEY